MQTAVHRERRDRARAVGGVVGDPGQGFAPPLAAIPLLGREVLLARARGSKTKRSVLEATSKTQRQPTGSSLARERRNATRDPSSATVNVRGRPNV